MTFVVSWKLKIRITWMLLKRNPRGKAPSWKSFSPLYSCQKRVFLAFSPFWQQDFVLLSLPKPIIASSVILIVKTIRHLTCHLWFKTLTQHKQILDGKSRECSSCDKKAHVTSVDAKESSADSVHQWWFSTSRHLDREKVAFWREVFGNQLLSRLTSLAPCLISQSWIWHLH